MQQITTRSAMRSYAHEARGLIGFVPTMGYLHEGHMSLVRRARDENEKVVASIFVNPAQFNDPADYEKYPVNLERDLEMLRAEGVDAVFTPPREEIYPHGIPPLRMVYDDLMVRLCGAHRPGHFEGVLLIVHNLFMWVEPRRAYFGLKDYQQYLLIRKMAQDLEMPVEVIGCPLVREADGLAMSSRNVRLSTGGRQKALAISRALYAAKAAWTAEHDLARLNKIMQDELAELEVEYAQAYDAESLEALNAASVLPRQVLLAVAAFADGVRLIDNMLL